MTWQLFLTLACLGVVAAVLMATLWWFGTYNQLAGLRAAVGQAEANVQVQLRQRGTMVPEAIAAANGSESFQERYLEKILKSRERIVDRVMRPAPRNSHGAHTGDLAPIVAGMQRPLPPQIHESNPSPDIRIREKALGLHAGMEDNVSAAQRWKEDAVATYNAAVLSFPNRIVARHYGFRPIRPYEASTFLRQPPKGW